MSAPTELDRLDPPPAPPKPPRHRKGPAELAVLGELKLYPLRLRKSAIAAAALLLARQMDTVPMVPRDYAGHTRELRMCMMQLSEQNPAGAAGDSTDAARQQVEDARRLYAVE